MLYAHICKAILKGIPIGSVPVGKVKDPPEFFQHSLFAPAVGQVYPNGVKILGELDG